jgi:hypothetical protein
MSLIDPWTASELAGENQVNPKPCSSNYKVAAIPIHRNSAIAQRLFGSKERLSSSNHQNYLEYEPAKEEPDGREEGDEEWEHGEVPARRVGLGLPVHRRRRGAKKQLHQRRHCGRKIQEEERKQFLDPNHYRTTRARNGRKIRRRHGP